MVKKNMSCNMKSCGGSGCAFYLLGVIGAAVHFVSTSSGFWSGVVAILKALVWPAFLVLQLFRFLG